MIADLKDLKALLKLCRSQGITEIKVAGVEIKFGDLPESEARSNYSGPSAVEDEADPLEGFPDRILTQEELIFYSSGGRPGEPGDPALKEKTA